MRDKLILVTVFLCLAFGPEDIHRVVREYYIMGFENGALAMRLNKLSGDFGTNAMDNTFEQFDAMNIKAATKSANLYFKMHP